MRVSAQISLALLSGVMACLSLPTMVSGFEFPELGWLAWIAMVPLFLSIRNVSPARAYLLSFASCMVLFCGSLFWIYIAVHDYGGLPPSTSASILLLLAAILSALLAAAPASARFLQAKNGGELIVWLPVAWTAAEIVRNFFPCNGFPWSNIAASQWRALHVIQIADLVGVYGVTFVLVWVNAFLADCAARLSGERVARLLPKAVMTAVILAAVFSYGAYRLYTFPPVLAANPSISVGLVQGNIAQDEKWERELAQKNLDVHREGAMRLAESGVEMIIWPEAAFPWPVEDSDTETDPRVLGFMEGGAGALPYTLLGAITKTAKGDFRNSAILFDGDGNIDGMYHKVHLVPFGEYVPYRSLLFFARKLTRPVGNFIAGRDYSPLSAGGRRFGVLICYEDVFPDIARKETARGAGFLVNLTNDAWYGSSSAPFQHLAISVFRAVENRRFLVRATNSGVSAVVMPTGETTVESSIFEPALIVSPVAILGGLTPYTRLGDWFAWGCAAYVALGFIMVFLKRIRRRG